jgi:hypothetical protein
MRLFSSICFLAVLAPTESLHQQSPTQFATVHPQNSAGRTLLGRKQSHAIRTFDAVRLSSSSDDCANNDSQVGRRRALHSIFCFAGGSVAFVKRGNALDMDAFMNAEVRLYELLLLSLPCRSGHSLVLPTLTFL